MTRVHNGRCSLNYYCNLEVLGSSPVFNPKKRDDDDPFQRKRKKAVMNDHDDDSE